ncbi:MAG: ribosome maturation factor RimM [Buchnera aphidicola (Nurudea yanoniella)]
MFSFTENKKNIFKYFPLYIMKEKTKKTIHICNWKNKNKYFIAKIKDVDDRSSAKTLTNKYINIDENVLPQLKKNDYYWKDIINCNVINESNEKLGIVSRIIKTPSNDILIIKNIMKNKNILIPFITKTIIKKINIAKKMIIVKWNQSFERI